MITFRNNILLLALLLLLKTQVEGQRCEVTPSSEGSKVDCHGLNLKHIPSDLPSDTVWLDMTDNALTSLENYTFEGLSRLEYVDLTSNLISKLEAKAFCGLSRLKYLSIEHNRLDLGNGSYPEKIFLPLRNLTYLNICANDKKLNGQIPDHIFIHTPNLETLFIDSFTDTKFGQGFSALTKLKSLHMHGRRWPDDEFYCTLKHLYNDTFMVFGNSSIEFLDLTLCMLSRVEPGAFSPLQNISTIILTDSSGIPIQNAIGSFQGLKQKTVKKLIFNKIYKYANSEIDKQVIKANTLPYIDDLCIEYIDLSDNNLLYIGPEIIYTISSCLKHLDISQNKLVGSMVSLLVLSNSHVLEYLDFSRQLKFSKRTVQSETESFRAPMRFPMPPKLRYIDFSECSRNIDKLGNIEFMNASSLQIMKMTQNGLRNLTHEIKGLQNVTHLDISGNDGFGITGQFISSFPKVKQLVMNGIQLEEKALLRGSVFFDGFRSLLHVEEISMESNNIHFIDDNIFSNMKELTLISLANNKLDSIDIDLQTMTKLTHLDLSLNSLTYLTPTTLAVLDHFGKLRNMSLNLQRNPFFCSCDTFYFIEWLFTTKVQLDAGGNYDCVTDNGVMTTTGEVHRRILYHWRRCQGRVWFSVALILLCVLLLVIMTWVALARNWTRIQHRLLMLLGRGAEQLKRQDFGKDAYVAHCEEDRQEVNDNLRHRLEHYGLRLVLPYRDFLPGRFIAENIAESVDESWKTVLVVTADFLLDPMSYFIMRTVSHSVSIHHQNRVILLLIGEVDRGRLPDSFVNIIDEDNVLELDVFPAVNSNVWMEIRDMILA